LLAVQGEVAVPSQKDALALIKGAVLGQSRQVVPEKTTLMMTSLEQMAVLTQVAALVAMKVAARSQNVPATRKILWAAARGSVRCVREPMANPPCKVIGRIVAAPLVSKTMERVRTAKARRTKELAAQTAARATIPATHQRVMCAVRTRIPAKLARAVQKARIHPRRAAPALEVALKEANLLVKGTNPKKIVRHVRLGVMMEVTPQIVWLVQTILHLTAEDALVRVPAQEGVTRTMTPYPAKDIAQLVLRL